jgi:hypothetical protein
MSAGMLDVVAEAWRQSAELGLDALARLFLIGGRNRAGKRQAVHGGDELAPLGEPGLIEAGRAAAPSMAALKSMRFQVKLSSLAEP